MAAPRACLCCGDTFSPRKNDSEFCPKATCQRARKAANQQRRRKIPLAAWPTDFERAERALVEQVRRRDTEPELAVERIVLAWRTAA